MSKRSSARNADERVSERLVGALVVEEVSEEAQDHGRVLLVEQPVSVLLAAPAPAR